MDFNLHSKSMETLWDEDEDKYPNQINVKTAVNLLKKK